MSVLPWRNSRANWGKWDVLGENFLKNKCPEVVLGKEGKKCGHEAVAGIGVCVFPKEAREVVAFQGICISPPWGLASPEGASEQGAVPRHVLGGECHSQSVRHIL